MKVINLIFISILLSSCTFGGFKPPPIYFHWYLPNAKKIIPNYENDDWLDRYIEKRIKDMRDCYIDPVTGETGNVERNLCFERKGWRLESGMVCDDELQVNRKSCIKWRAECQAGKMKKDIPCQEWRAKHGY